MKTFRRYFYLLCAFLLLGLNVSMVSADDPAPTVGDAVSISGEQPGGIQPNFSGCTRVDVAAVNADFEQQVVEQVNQQRWANGQLPPYKRLSALDLSARYHAKDMHDDGYFAHDSYDNGGQTLACAWSTRIKNWYTGWNALGENIAGGYTSPSAVMTAWMNSSGHRANILDPNYRELGVGFYTGYLWVQDFGRRSSVYPLVINREAASTSSDVVSLYIYGSTSTFSQMHFKNDGGSWSSWVPFSNNYTWTLAPTKGLRTVTVEFKDTAGNVVANQSSDDITLLATTGLGGLPDKITFVYAQSPGKWYPATISLNPQNIVSSSPLSWSIAANNAWINYTPSGGTTQSGTSSVSIQGNPGNTSGSVTITSTTPVDVGSNIKTITVQVIVVANMNNKVFLPFVQR